MIPRNRRIYAQLYISRPDGTWVDVTDYLAEAEVELGNIEDIGTGTGADIAVHTASFTLRNHARNSFSPKDRDSAWNLLNGEWVPLLWPYRHVVFRVAAAQPGQTPAWINLFEGLMGNDITVEGHLMKFECRDLAKRMQDMYIDEKKTYESESGIAAEDLIQAIISDFVIDPPILYCPVPSGITFTSMTVEHCSVWDAIQSVARQIGWYLGYHWNGTEFALMFMEPPRNKVTPDFELEWTDDIIHQTPNISDRDIRNALVISFRDKATGERRTLNYKDYPELRNDRSKDEFGGQYRVMEIDEADTSLIDSVEKALAFGAKCVWDLSELSETDKFDLPLLPEMDLFSTFTVENPLVSSTKDFFAVQSIRHSFKFDENGRFRTEVVAACRVVGGKTKWKRMETRPGSPGDPRKQGPPGEPGYVPPKPADPVWGSYTLTSALHLTWYKAEHATGYEIRDDLNWGSAAGMLFQGYAHSFSFIPTEREMILYLRALNVAGEYSEGYDTIHVSLPAPEPPQQPTVEAYFNALKIQPTPLDNPSVMGYFVYVAGDGIDEKLAVIAGGNINYPAPSGTTVTIQVSAYDVIGEGGKSEPLQATTTALDDMDIPDWVKEPLEAIEEKWVIDTDEEGNISGLVKVDDPEQDGSHIAILVDRFSIATPQGRKQIFVFDAQDQKLYLVGDLIAEGLIRATEVQAEVAKALLMQAELGVFDEIHGLRIRADKITVGGGAPGLVIAKPSNSHLWHFDTGLVSTDGIKPLDGAVATLRPNEGRFGGAVAVEEGTENLAYNPTFSGTVGGNAPLGYSLSTQNTVPDIAKLVQSPWETQGVLAYHVKVNDARAYLSLSSSHRRHIEAAEGDIFTISFYATSNDVQVWYRILDDDLSILRDVTNASFTNTNGDQYVHVTEPLPAGARYFYVERIGIGVSGRRTGEAIFERLQVEKKPFATSFVDGTRPDGILAYPIALKDDYTIACYRKSHTDEDYKHVVKRSDGKVFVDGVEDSGYDVGWIAGRNLVPNNLDFWEIGTVRESSVVGSSYDVVKGPSTTRIRTKELILVDDIYTVSFNEELFDVFFVYFDEDKKYLGTYRGWSSGGYTYSTAVKYVAITLRYKTNDNISIDAIKQSRIKIEKGSTATDWTPAPEDLGYSDDCLMFSNQTGLIDELLILPYAATDAEIKAWYGMGAPFYDPSPMTPIDASQRPVSVQGAGADIDIDKYGIRATRKADGKKTFEIDAETGDAYFKGDITGATGTFSGELAAKSIKAEWYADIRNVIAYAGTDNLDADHPIEVDFYIPTETTNIVSINVSAKALRYRAYARTADAGGSHTHQVVIPAHVHGVSLIANESRGVTDSGGVHTHNYGATGATSNIADITTASGGDHSHSYWEADGTDSVSHYHTVLEMYGETDTDTHSHSIEYSSANTSSDGSHGGHFSGTITGVHSHSIADGGAHIHLFDYYNTVPWSTTVASDAVIETTEYSESHTHDLDYGIYLDTTPANVQLFCSNDGVNYDSAINLEPAPSDSYKEYVLATERQLTANFSGTGWKRIKFTSSRRGRITWHLIAKLDITA